MPNRRLLLQGLGGAVFAAASATAASAVESRERVRLTKSYVVNLADSALVYDALIPGAALALMREPHRRFDASSIGVFQKGEHIGYLPGNQSRILAPLMDAGFELEARVARAERSPHPAVDLQLYILPS